MTRNITPHWNPCFRWGLYPRSSVGVPAVLPATTTHALKLVEAFSESRLRVCDGGRPERCKAFGPPRMPTRRWLGDRQIAEPGDDHVARHHSADHPDLDPLRRAPDLALQRGLGLLSVRRHRPCGHHPAYPRAHGTTLGSRRPMALTQLRWSIRTPIRIRSRREI